MNTKKSKSLQSGDARLHKPERRQIAYRDVCWDQLLSESHLARDVWSFSESLDLSELYSSIQARQGTAGRHATDPRVLFALWLFATLEGFSSARRLAKLTERDLPYLWLRGDVPINYHMLSDFRANHGELLERVLTESIAVLHHQGLVTLETIGHDGMRVRASAGSGSFKRKGKLEESLAAAKDHIKKVREQDDDDHDGGQQRLQSARQRAAREKQERLEHALLEMEDMQQKYEKRGSKNGTQQRSEPRASKTDPESRRMKMGDGGIRPAFNVQFASDGDAQVIVSVDVSSQGSDAGLMKPMYEDICQRYAVTPKHYLVDGGFNKKADIGELENNGTLVYAPVHQEKKQLENGEDPYARRPKESDAVAAHRERMGTEDGQALRQRRGQIAEFPNAVCRNDGLHQYRVRGKSKVKAQTLWHAIAHNLKRFKNLVCLETQRTYLEILMAD